MANFERLRAANNQTAAFLNHKTLYPSFGRPCTVAVDAANIYIKYGKIFKETSIIDKNLEKIIKEGAKELRN